MLISKLRSVFLLSCQLFSNGYLLKKHKYAICSLGSYTMISLIALEYICKNTFTSTFLFHKTSWSHIFSITSIFSLKKNLYFTTNIPSLPLNAIVKSETKETNLYVLLFNRLYFTKILITHHRKYICSFSY